MIGNKPLTQKHPAKVHMTSMKEHQKHLSLMRVKETASYPLMVKLHYIPEIGTNPLLYQQLNTSLASLTTIQEMNTQ